MQNKNTPDKNTPDKNLLNKNNYNQPIGQRVPGWNGVASPQAMVLQGQYCDVVPLNAVTHAGALYAANSHDNGGMWTYLPYGPFDTVENYQTWLANYCATKDLLFYAIIDKNSKQALGIASFLRIDSSNGVIEVGHIAYSPLLQRSTLATEAMYLMMDYVFTLGFRRYEWKCNALNAPSCQAAKRLGFTLEGIFRQAAIVKNHNRDTAWYSIIDTDWPVLKIAFQTWLNPDNFDTNGQQLSSLATIMAQTIHR